MRDIFITPQPALLSSWLAAFPKAEIFSLVPKVVEKNTKTAKSKVGELTTELENKNLTVFWLHMNVDRQQWMTNTIALILKDFQHVKIVVLANSPNQAEALHALSLGAVGYCHAYSSAELLKEVKTVISHGGIWLGQALLQRLIEVSTKLAGNKPEYVEGLLLQLTKREKDVAIEAAKGFSNKEIARILNITERTVKAHLSSTFERLAVKDRLQLALILNSNYHR